MGFFNNFIDTYKETKRRNASYYRSYDNSKKIKGKRNKVLDYVFSDIQRKTELGRYCIEILSWTSVCGGINLYNEIIKEEEYFKSKGFDFKVKDRGDFGKIITISWWRDPSSMVVSLNINKRKKDNMENLVKKELVRVASNNPYGFNRDLWREHKDELLSYFDVHSEDMPEEDMVMCCFFTENIPIGIDLYTVLTGKDIFKEVDLLEKDYLDLGIAGFTVSLEIDLNGNLIHASMRITLQDGGTFIDTLLNDVIYLEDIFYERAIEYYKAKQDANFKYLELLIDQLVTDENVTEEDKRKFLIDVMERLNKLEGEK